MSMDSRHVNQCPRSRTRGTALLNKSRSKITECQFRKASYGNELWECSPVPVSCHGHFLRELFPITRQPRRGWSTKSAASSASLMSVLRGVPISARIVRPRPKSVTWIARSATGKSDGISPALIPSRKRPSTSAAPPAAAFCRNCRTSASSTSGATQIRRQPRADPFSVALSTANLRKPAIESRRLCGERSAFAR